MKEHGISISVYQSGSKFDWILFLKRALVFAVSVLVTRLCVRLLIMNLWFPILRLTGSDEMADIFMQIKTAYIRPSWLIPIIFSFLVSLMMIRKKKETEGSEVLNVFVNIGVGFAVTVLFVITLLLSVYLTEVNQVQVSKIIKVLYPLIKSGALDGIL